MPNALRTGVKEPEFGRYFRKCFRFAAAYRLGANYALAEFAARKYKSHRVLPKGLTIANIVGEATGPAQAQDN